MPKRLLLSLAVLSTPLLAAELDVEIEIPRLQVAEYHRPYVAVWLERPDQSHVANLAVWYDLKLADKEGEKWLKDMRQWWRRSGRSLEMPVDGVSAATRAVGQHRLSFNDKDAAFRDLPAGEYRVVIEAAREVGGRELQRLPFQWPVTEAGTVKAQGSSELGSLSLTFKP